jgi:hypothetical protein
MTEDEWLAPETSFDDLLREEEGLVSDRQKRLFVCACVRQAWGLLEEPCQALIDIAERFADRQAGRSELERAWSQGWVVVHLALGNLANRAAVLAASTRPLLSRDEIRNACNLACQGMVDEAAWAYLRGLLAVEEYRDLEPAVRDAQEALFRDIVGNPFRQVRVKPAWLTWNDALVVRLAGEIYDERRWAEMPILGDALEDAGCVSADILEHCHGPGPHTRGCWVVDAILERK